MASVVSVPDMNWMSISLNRGRSSHTRRKGRRRASHRKTQSSARAGHRTRKSRRRARHPPGEHGASASLTPKFVVLAPHVKSHQPVARVSVSAFVPSACTVPTKGCAKS